LVRAYAHTFGLPATISNCSNNYGPYHFPEKLVPLSIVRALLGLALPLYGDGRQVRDWLYVEDHCVAIGRILAADVVGETFNVGGRAELENIELVRKLCAIIDTKFAEDPEIRRRFPSCPAASGRPCSELITFVRDRPGHDRRYAIDASKIESQLTFVPRHSIDAGLASTVSWYTENESWWRAVMDGSYREWILQQYGGA
jgi:dTDP-glucose 4,6-dehydratase